MTVSKLSDVCESKRLGRKNPAEKKPKERGDRDRLPPRLAVGRGL